MGVSERDERDIFMDDIYEHLCCSEEPYIIYFGKEKTVNVINQLGNLYNISCSNDVNFLPSCGNIETIKQDLFATASVDLDPDDFIIINPIGGEYESLNKLENLQNGFIHDFIYDVLNDDVLVIDCNGYEFISLCDSMFDIITSFESIIELQEFIENYTEYNICCPESEFWIMGNTNYIESNYGDTYNIQTSHGISIIDYEHDISEYIDSFSQSGILDEIIDIFNIDRKYMSWDCEDEEVEVGECQNIIEALYYFYEDYITVNVSMDEIIENFLESDYDICCADCETILYYSENKNSFIYDHIIENDINICCSNDIDILESQTVSNPDIIIPDCIYNEEDDKNALFQELEENGDDFIIINPLGGEYNTLLKIFEYGDEDFVRNFVKYFKNNALAINCDASTTFPLCYPIIDWIADGSEGDIDLICCPENGFWAFGDEDFMTELYGDYPLYTIQIENGLALIDDTNSITDITQLFDNYQQVKDYYNGEIDGKPKIVEWDCETMKIREKCPNLYEVLYDHYSDYRDQHGSKPDFMTFFTDFIANNKHEALCCDCPVTIYYGRDLTSQVANIIQDFEGFEYCCSNDINYINETYIPDCNAIDPDKDNLFNEIMSRGLVLDGVLDPSEVIIINPAIGEYTTLLNILDEAYGEDFIIMIFNAILGGGIIINCDNYQIIRRQEFTLGDDDWELGDDDWTLGI